MDKWTGADVLALRKAKRMTQEEFAACSELGVRTIGKWETAGARFTLGDKFADSMDAMLGQLNDEQRRRFHDAAPLAAIKSTASAMCLDSSLDAELRVWIDMNRRQLMRLFGGLAGGMPAIAALLAELDGDERGRIARVIAKPETVDTRAVDDIENALRICMAQNDSYGPRAVLAMVLAQRAITSALLDQSSSQLERRLLTLHSSLSQLAGWIYFDLRDYAAAGCCYEDAREAAHNAGDEDLVVLVLCNMSYMATWRGAPRTGIDHAVAAQNWANRSGDALLRAYADDMAAIAYANDRQHLPCLRALDAADAGLSDVPQQTSQTSLAYFHGPGLSASFRSDCLLHLGSADDACRAAEESLALIDGSFVRNRALATLDLAGALSASGEIDESARLLGESAALAAPYRSDRLIERIGRARKDLSNWQDASSVRDLDDRLAVYGFSSFRT